MIMLDFNVINIKANCKSRERETAVSALNDVKNRKSESCPSQPSLPILYPSGIEAHRQDPLETRNMHLATIQRCDGSLNPQYLAPYSILMR